MKNLATARAAIVPGVAALVLLYAAVLAGPAAPLHDETATHQGGMTIAIDPDGAIRMPTPAERAELAKRISAEFNQSIEGLEIVEHENGMRSVDLKGRFQSMSVARYDESGQLVHDCFDDPQAATDFLMSTEPKKLEVR